MKNRVFIFFSIIILTSCDNTIQQLGEHISGADSIAINYFKGDGKMDTVTAVKIIRDKKSIEDITALMTESSVSVKDKCGYDGSIHFFKNDKVIQDVFFNSTQEDCRLFLFQVKGNDIATELDDNAKEFLSSQKSNRN